VVREVVSERLPERGEPASSPAATPVEVGPNTAEEEHVAERHEPERIGVKARKEGVEKSDEWSSSRSLTPLATWR